MAEPSNLSSRLQSVGAMLAAVLISGLIAAAVLTDLPAKLGLRVSAVSSAVGHDQDTHDQDGQGHDDVHEHSDHAGHDHAGHDHAGHDHAGHDHEVALDDASLPPMPLDDAQLIDDSASTASHQDHTGHDHAGHDHSTHGHADDPHDHEGHSEDSSITLSTQARKNLRLIIKPVTSGAFTRYVDVPGVVTDWPGKTHIDVTSPLTGVINSIEVTRGQLISDDSSLFTLRMTHQDLVKTQESFLSQLGQRDVEDREVKRLATIASTGAVARKTLIERNYERDKLLATIRAARQSLLLHGLTEHQIKHIEDDRELIREVIVRAPEVHEDDSLHHDAISHSHSHSQHDNNLHLAAHEHSDSAHPVHKRSDFLVTALDVNRGQSVVAGERLTRLSDYSELLIEGHAFQSDSDLLRRAAVARLPLQAVWDSTGGKPTVVEDLQIVNIGSEIDRESRTLPFFVGLTNEIERSEIRKNRRYASWKYKPGQRLRIRIPTKKIEGVIVLPVEAVAQEGAERYVFVENSDHFDRVPVTVLQQDSMQVAIAQDELLKIGHTVVLFGAHDLQMAMRNKSGAGVDPHAGHSH